MAVSILIESRSQLEREESWLQTTELWRGAHLVVNLNHRRGKLMNLSTRGPESVVGQLLLKDGSKVIGIDDL